MHILLGLIIAFVTVAIVARVRGGRRHCQWRRNKRLDRGDATYFTCTYCGAETWVAQGQGAIKDPKGCLRPPAP